MFANGEDGLDEEAAPAPVVEPPVQSQEAPAQQPQQVQPATAPQQAAPLVAPAQVPAQQQVGAVPAQVGQQPTQAQPLPEDALRTLHTQLEKNRETVVTALSKSYADTFTDADLEEFDTDRKVAFSKMASRLHVDIAQNVLGTVAHHMPTIVNGLIEAQRRHTMLEDRLYTAYPQLDRAQHSEIVKQIAVTFRQLNPQADAASTIRAVGAIALQQLGVTQAAPAPTQQQPVAPRSFQPAANGSAGARPKANDNQWNTIDSIVAADDRGAFETR